MTLQQLKYVAMVEKCGSFSKASEKLYVAQPSISNLVHALEKELGITIFDRSSMGITITNEGRDLLRLGNKLLKDANYIKEHFHAKEENFLSFHVSSQHYDFVMQAFSNFTKEINSSPYSQYTLGLNQTQTSEVINDVRKQHSNLGIIFLSDINSKNMKKTLNDNNLDFYIIAKTKPHIFVSKKHPLAEKVSVKPEELMDYPCILYEQNYSSPGFFSEEMLLPNFYPKKVIYVSDLYVSTNVMRDCNAYDIGTGLLSKHLSKEFSSIPIDVDDIVDIGWIGIKGKLLKPIETLFLDYLKKQMISQNVK